MSNTRQYKTVRLSNGETIRFPVLQCPTKGRRRGFTAKPKAHIVACQTAQSREKSIR